ncbi:AraC family transcriptional regulator [Rhizobium sp. BK376]|uniref:AraC family transcriptional regulator n=1 Tax=Rhizobium sp. BK376 TaxID=2512149 RepID=UPI0010482A22|nr:AraC family transcriptional regulator [Rhizobium sp. BK376]TCR83899.1 AraC-like DNA-binding protein [Rhizobium sp. BK376]
MAAGGFRMLRCEIEGVEAVEAETCHSFPRHMHEQFGIGLIYRGAQKSLSGRGIVEASAGSTITVNPGEVHDGMPIGDHGRAWRMLYFEPRLIAEAIEDMSESKTDDFEFSQPVIDRDDIALRFERLYRALTTRGETIRYEEALLTLVASVQPDRKDSPSPPSSVARAQSLIDDDPAKALTLADLAQEAGLSRFQLLRSFAQANGLTPHAYILQRRVNMARRLIARRTPLAEAALEAGFADQSHMTRIFRRTFGVSPGAYADAVA